MVQLMPLHPKTPSSLASPKSRLFLPFWYRLTQVVLQNRPLTICSSSSCSTSSTVTDGCRPYSSCDLMVLSDIDFAGLALLS